jgi:hypothetical protein
VTTFTVTVPADTAPETVDTTTPARSRAGAGARRAKIPGATLDAARPRRGARPVAGLRLGRDERGLVLLPLYAWMSMQTTSLTPHPSDPALTSG